MKTRFSGPAFQFLVYALKKYESQVTNNSFRWSPDENLFPGFMITDLCGSRGGSVVGASALGYEGRKFDPWPVHLRCVLKQNT